MGKMVKIGFGTFREKSNNYCDSVAINENSGMFLEKRGMQYMSKQSGNRLAEVRGKMADKLKDIGA